MILGYISKIKGDIAKQTMEVSGHQGGGGWGGGGGAGYRYYIDDGYITRM